MDVVHANRQVCRPAEKTAGKKTCVRRTYTGAILRKKILSSATSVGQKTQGEQVRVQSLLYKRF